ncbi:MAG: helix-turn-helix domain-containing protein, partial [Bacteroidota bacterium]
RQLKNMVEQLSIIETERSIDRTLLQHYLPEVVDKGALMINTPSQESISEREIMYKFLFDMKRDLTDLKKLVVEILSQTAGIELDADQNILLNKLYQDFGSTMQSSVLPSNLIPPPKIQEVEDQEDFTQHEDFEESLSLEERERELIQKALEKHRGKRKYAAKELGISERTLYRKIKEFNLAE